METHQREKEKPWFQVNCKKNNCHVTLEANQANRPRNTHSLGFATTSMRGQGHFAKTKHGQDKNGNEKDKRRQTERAPLKPFFAVCPITFPFGGGAAEPPSRRFFARLQHFCALIFHHGLCNHMPTTYHHGFHQRSTTNGFHKKSTTTTVTSLR